LSEITDKLLVFVQANGRGASYPDVLTTPLFEVIDSVDMLGFLEFIEENFELTIDLSDVTPEDFENLQTVASFVSAQQEAQQ
jgi:acyl carrier protein